MQNCLILNLAKHIGVNSDYLDLLNSSYLKCHLLFPEQKNAENKKEVINSLKFA